MALKENTLRALRNRIAQMRWSLAPPPALGNCAPLTGTRQAGGLQAGQVRGIQARDQPVASRHRVGPWYQQWIKPENVNEHFKVVTILCSSWQLFIAC